MAGREVRVAILGDSRDFSRAVSSASHDAKRLDTTFGSVAGSVGKMAKAVALGVAALGVGAVAIGKSLVDAAIESEKVTKQTEAVLKSMGDAAGVTAKHVSRLSDVLSMQTGIDDELISSGQNLLLTFGQVRNGVGKTNQIFDRATKAALDMSVALGTDMKSAAMLVGKALNDPIKGLTALTRSGIQFTEEQKKQIKTMVAAGDVMGAQKIMLSELEKQFGGSAEAQATAGERLSVIWGNLQEKLGEKLLPMFNTVATWLSEHLPAAIDTATPYLVAFGEFVGEVGKKVAEFVKEKLQQLRAWWDEHGPAITAAAQGFAEDFDKYILQPMGTVAAYIKDELIPKFQSFITWILENKWVLETLGVLVGVTLVAHFVAAGAAAVAAAFSAAAAWAALVGPILIAAGAVYLFSAATQWVMGQRWFNDMLQFFIDTALAVWNLVSALGTVIPLLGTAIGLAKQAAGAIAGALDATGAGPKNAKVNPITGEPVPQRDHGGIVPGTIGSPQLILAHGGEMVSPNHRTLDWGGGTEVIQIVLDGRVVAESVRRHERGLR